MKISFMTFACPEWTFDQVVSAAMEHGYQGLEFRCDIGHRHGVEVTTTTSERRAFVRRLEAAGVNACCLATSLQFAGDKAVKDAPARIGLAADLGCPLVRVFGGPIPEGMDVNSAIDKIAVQLREVADLAEESGVTLLLETHDTMSKGAHAGAAVRKADHRAVAINYDNMHPYRYGESLEETFAAVNGLVRHCHFHDAINSSTTVVIKPFGQGEMPMDDMFTTLVNSGFDGYISGEWFKSQYGDDLNEALAHFHRDVTTLAQRYQVSIGA